MRKLSQNRERKKSARYSNSIREQSRINQALALALNQSGVSSSPIRLRNSATSFPAVRARHDFLTTSRGDKGEKELPQSGCMSRI